MFGIWEEYNDRGETAGRHREERFTNPLTVDNLVAREERLARRRYDSGLATHP